MAFDFPPNVREDAASAAPSNAAGGRSDTVVLHATAVRLAVMTVRAHVRSVARKAATHRDVRAVDPDGTHRWRAIS
ncbi:MAG TPA: hypothetical protein VFC33_10390 [Acidimicrobiia bacterium]|nr:hypothetical protein [Acidimicrobiia bacterium]